MPQELIDGREQLKVVERFTRPRRMIGALIVGIAMLIFSLVLSVSLGAANIVWGTVWKAVVQMGGGA